MKGITCVQIPTKHRHVPPAERLRAWTHHLRSVPQNFKAIPSEDLKPGYEAPWLHWKYQTKNWNDPLQIEHTEMELQ